MINNKHTLTPAPAPPPEEACLRVWGTFWILSSLGSDLEELQHCLNMILSYPGQQLPSNQFLETRGTSVCKNMSYSWWSLSKVLFCHCLCLFQSFLDSIAAATKLATAAVDIISVSARPIKYRRSDYWPIGNYFSKYQHTTKLKNNLDK